MLTRVKMLHEFRGCFFNPPLLFRDLAIERGRKKQLSGAIFCFAEAKAGKSR
jgi:hypothetical protein